MPRLTYSPAEAHQLLTASETAAEEHPDLAALYADLATHGIDLDACTPDDDLRAELGMPPLTPAGTGDDDAEGGHHPHVA